MAQIPRASSKVRFHWKLEGHPMLCAIDEHQSSLMPGDARPDHPVLYWLAVWGLAILAALAVGA
jgi:hypothetical protein